MDIATIENKLRACDNDIVSLMENIDKIMSELNVKDSLSQSSTSRVIKASNNGGKYLQFDYGGNSYNVIKTPNISVLAMLDFIQKYHLYQVAHVGYKNFDNKCLGVAKAYGRSLMMGKLPKNIDDFYGGAYTYYDSGKSYANKNDLLKVVYNELSRGIPCVIMVTTQAGNRHFATVVGMKQDVGSASDLREEDLLIIDAWDGKLETMDRNSDRHLYRDYQGNYRVDVFLSSKLTAKK